LPDSFKMLGVQKQSGRDGLSGREEPEPTVAACRGVRALCIRGGVGVGGGRAATLSVVVTGRGPGIAIDWPGVGAGAGPIPLGTLAGALGVPAGLAAPGAVLVEPGPLICARASVGVPKKHDAVTTTK
jgi:hypothetical protein